MRLLMNVIKDRHGTYYARKKIPVRLQEAVARVLGNGKPRQTWLKRSLGTKDIGEANVRAKPVQIKFDQIIAQAEVQLKARPLRTSITDIEIKRIADFFYAHELGADEELREDSRGSDPLFVSIHKQLTEAGVQFHAHYDPGSLTLEPGHGLSPRMMAQIEDDATAILSVAEDALARGDITRIRYEVDALLDVFQINLDPSCADYRKLARAVLAAFVKQLRAVLARHKGEPVDTPPLPAIGATDFAATGETLTGALEGWKRQREPAPGTLTEYQRAVRLFTELHGDIPVVQIRRSHARQFREALQDVPRTRAGKLLTAPLPELAQWGREHTEVEKISAETVNKILSGVQAVAVWARDNGMVPDDVQWADPFANMRLGKGEARRGGAPFEPAELTAIFSTPVFAEGARPTGGKGDAVFWLPLLALFTGARLGELAGLRASDVAHDPTIGAQCIYITADAKAGKRLKTKQSARAVPIHPQLTEVGFLKFVASQAKARGKDAWLFPEIAPGTTGTRAFSKWFGRYIGEHGVTDASKVFHSFRHNFTDALRVAAVSDEVNRALVGHTQSGVHGRYGAKDMAARFRHRLAEAVDSVTYNGLDLSHLTNHRTALG